MSAFSLEIKADSEELARQAEKLIKHRVMTEGHQIILPYRGTHQAKYVAHNVVDGRRIDSWLASEVDSKLWNLLTHTFRPVTPRVSLNGRFYFGAKHGAVVCLGAEQP